MLAGWRRKWVIAIPFLIGTYFGFRDLWTMGSHFLILIWTYLFALLLETKGRSASRRIIQISIFFCYFYSAVQKLLCPDFTLGYSLQAEISDGWALNELWRSWLRLEPPMIFWQLFAWLTVFAEAYIAFALFSPKLRRSAFILGIVFHLGISLFLDWYISLFSLAALISYLAFVDRKSEAVNPEYVSGSAPGSRLEHAGVLAFVALMTAVPLRIYFFPERPLNTIVMLDRTPWSYCMFLDRTDTKSVQIRYKTEAGRWYDVPVTGRTRFAVIDSEVYSIANWVFQQHPEAQQVTVRLELEINRRWTQVKQLYSTREHGGVIEVTSLI
jgi:hypothetical protein